MFADGRRVNHGRNGLTIGPAPAINIGMRVNPSTYHSSNSALTNSFMRADNGATYTSNPTSPYNGPVDDRYSHHHQLGRQPSLENGLPTIDTTYSSNPTSTYGSPRDDDASRLGLGLSPANKGLSVLDAPLPASFDSNGISHAARYGPWPSSVPSKFGLDSPSPSLNAAKDGRTSETLKLLHTSAFGSSDHLSSSALGASAGAGHVNGPGGDLNGFGSSPPAGAPGIHALGGSGSMGFLAGDEYLGKRAMHSSSLRYAKPRLLSSSVPKVDRDWETEFLFEEDYVPGALANEVLTPAEKARRGSTTNTLRASGAGDGFSDMAESVASNATTKYGSPASGASPSRWGPLFQRQRDDEAATAANMLETGNGSLGGASGSRSMKHAASAFGHVGSPLRNSYLASGLGAELNGTGTSTGTSSTTERFGLSGRSGSGVTSNSSTESLSVLTQQLQRTRMGDDNPGGSSPRLHPRGGNGGLTSTIAGTIGKEREREREQRERGLERHVSSGSIGSSVTGRFTTPIDEEDASFVFSMEEEDEAQMRTRRRTSGCHMGTASPLSSTWNYPTPGATVDAASNVMNGGAGRETAVETGGR